MDERRGPAPGLPDNPGMRTALSTGDPGGVTVALAVGTVVLGMTGPSDEDPVVLVEPPSGGKGLLVFTGPGPWETWARGPGRPRHAGAIEGSRLLATAEAQHVGQVVVDPAGPFPVVMTVEQLRALTAPSLPL